MAYAYLLIAILSEVLATSMLKASDGFTKLLPSIITFIGYSVSFYFLSMVLKYIRSVSLCNLVRTRYRPYFYRRSISF